MPELPEVETVMRALHPVLADASVTSVRLTRPDLRWPLPANLDMRLTGRTIKTPYRRAKYILLPLDGDETLLLHLGMSGSVRLYDSQPSFAKHDHFSLETSEGRWMVFSDPRRFGHIDLIPDGQLEQSRYLGHLGIEPLSNSLSGPYLAEQLAGKTAPIKSALLDQRIIAGLGNIYVCEALFKSGISPRRKAGTVKAGRAERLVQAIRTTLAAAIEAGGTSLRDHVQPGGEIGYFVQKLSVYGRAGQPCYVCSSEIRSITQSGRTSFYCPSCQG